MPFCQTSVFDSKTKRWRKCRLKPKWNCLCSTHSREYAIKIQAAWRRYRVSKKVALFKELGDPWQIILKYIEYNNRYAEILSSEKKIYEKRYEYHGDQAIISYGRSIFTGEYRGYNYKNGLYHQNKRLETYYTIKKLEYMIDHY